MPEPNWTKVKPYPLSNLITHRSLVRVLCRYCKRQNIYRPNDLIEIFGDVDVDSLASRIICEGGRDHGNLDISTVSPQGSDAVGLRIRRLVAIKMVRVPVWRDD